MNTGAVGATKPALAFLDPKGLDDGQREAVGRAIAADPLLDVSVWAGWLGIDHTSPKAQAQWAAWCAEGVGAEGSAGAVIVPLARSLGWDGSAAVSDAAVAQPVPNAPRLRLPPWEAVRASNPPGRSPVLVDGILRRGHVGLLAGGGKSAKSFLAMELSIAVATGGSWLGHRCRQGRVLFVDPEIDANSAHNRFAAVCEAAGVDAAIVGANVDKWALRGVPDATIGNVVADLSARCSFGDYALVVLDSASVFVEGDENSSVDVWRFAAQTLRIAAITGASVLVIHHYGKGNAGDRRAGERARGSSVWLDFPDAPLYLTEIVPPDGSASDYLGDGESAFVLESGGLREFPPMEPSHVIYGYPLHRLDGEGVTAEWKPRSGAKAGGQRSGDVRRARADLELSRFETRLVFEFVRRGIDPSEGMPLKDVCDVCGCSAKTAKVRAELSTYFELSAPRPRRCNVVLVGTPPMLERGEE